MEDKIFDKVFKEKMEAFGAPPPANTFANIQAQMAAAARSRKRALFIRIAAAAVLIGLAFVAGWMLMDSNEVKPQIVENKSTQSIENTISESKSELNETNIVIEKSIEKPKIENNLTNNIEINRKQKIVQKQKPKILNEEPGIIRESLNQLSYLTSKLAQIIPQSDEINTFSLKPIKNRLFSVLSDAEKDLITLNELTTKNEPDKNSWKVGVQVSPGYSSNTSRHSNYYAQNMVISESKNKTNMGGGVSVIYKTSKKWSIQSGIYYSPNGQRSNNPNFWQPFSNNKDSEVFNELNLGSGIPVASNSVGELAMNSSAGVIQLDKTPSNAEILTGFEAQYSRTNSLSNEGELSQVFNFVEIPLYLRYRLIESKIGVELLGGVNANLLVGNNVFIDGENVGETADISSINYSGTLGFGVNYALGKHFSFSIEPRINYFLSSINKSSEVNYRPYRIGIYTGVSYEF